MHNYKFILNGTQDITDHILQFNYSDNLDDFASSFRFDYVDSEGSGDLGLTSLIDGKQQLNKIQINKSGVPFYVGYITDSEHTNDKNKLTYSGFDVGFYLNKNEVIKQFKNSNIGDAIEELCKEYQINLETKPVFKQSVSKFYKDEIFSDVIKELLKFERDKGGRDDYYVDCKSGNFAIRKYEYKPQLGSVIANNILVDSFQTVNNVNVKHSIQELKNRVIYTDNNQKSTMRITRQDNQSIATYGLLTDVEKVDTKKENNLVNVNLAQTKLKELNKIKDTISLSMLGNSEMKKGIVIPLDIAEYQLSGKYLITSASHNINCTDECVNIAVEKTDAF